MTDQCFDSRATYGAYMQAFWHPGRATVRIDACAASARPAFACAKRRVVWQPHWMTVRC